MIGKRSYYRIGQDGTIKEIESREIAELSKGINDEAILIMTPLYPDDPRSKVVTVHRIRDPHYTTFSIPDHVEDGKVVELRAKTFSEAYEQHQELLRLVRPEK